MLGSLYLPTVSTFSAGCHGLSPGRVVAYSVAKREYLRDYKPITDVKYASNQVILLFAKSFLIVGSELSIEYTNEEMKCLQENRTFRFNWDRAISKYKAKLEASLVRSSWILVIRKALEALVVAELPPRIADKLTKNILASANRKLRSSTATFTRLFSTGFRGASLLFGSYFIVDMLYGAYRWAVSKEKGVNAVTTVLFIGKKIVLYSVCLCSSAAGYAMGSLIHPTYLAPVAQTLFESAAFIALASL